MKNQLVVSVIILNYNGKRFLNECLSSVLAMDFPKDQFEVLLVDNDSKDNSVEYVTENFPRVRIIQSNVNLGFAGGCNLGVKNAKGEFVVLLNTDTRVEKLWLKELVKSIRADKKIAAVNSKIFLYYPFFEMTIHSDIFMRSEFSDTVNFQSVGVLVEDVIIDDRELQSLIRFGKGFYEKELGIIPARWTKGDAVILIPTNPHKEKIGMTITIRSEKSISGLDTRLSIKLGERELIRDKLKSYEVKQYKISLKTQDLQKHLRFAVQNSGVVVFKSGHGRDRGAAVRGTYQFYEMDNPFYSKKTEINAFTGASVIIRKDVFENLGGFDEAYFMYYEDLDLSLRMKRAGWKIIYEPKSIVYHIHSGSSGEWSSFFTYNVEKNHLATLIKHFPISRVFYGFLRYQATWFIAILKMIKWRLSEHWELYDSWREKVEYKTKVLNWIYRNLASFIKKRYEINLKQKKSLKQIFKQLY